MVKGMILGIDFSKDYTQMAYLDEKGNPKSLSFGTADNFLIPTVACYHKELKEWYAGEEAVNKKTGENCVFYEKLPELSSEKSGEKNIELIQSYLSHLLQWAQAGQENRKIKNIVITLEEVRPDLLEVITEALLRLGYPSEDIKIISHSESLVYYMLNQNREIWINQVYYLHMNDEQFSLRQLKVLHGRGPSVAYVDMEDLTQLVSMKTVTENPRHADEILASYLEERFKHNIVSGIYLSGEGFYAQDWKQSISLMCPNRRVFKGNNLMVKGAVYAAKEFFYTPVLENYLISCKGRTRVKVTMSVKYKERDHFLTLSNVGDYWSQAKAKAECIMEAPTKALFFVDDLLNRKKDSFEMDLTGFPERPEKTTRIEVDFSYISEDRFEIVVRDLGFGELFKSSGKEVRKVYQLQS